MLADFAGKDVLCLDAAGGQQTVPFGLLGARVTSVDITEGQLAGDCTVAPHYGYEIATIRADMRDLSPLYADAFYLVSLAGERIGQYCARPARRRETPEQTAIREVAAHRSCKSSGNSKLVGDQLAKIVETGRERGFAAEPVVDAEGVEAVAVAILLAWK